MPISPPPGRILRAAAILLAAGLPALALAAGGFILPALGAALLGLCWLAVELRSPGQLAGLGLVLCCGFSAYALWQNLPGFLALLGVLAALAAWDLARFYQRITSGNPLAAEGADDSATDELAARLARLERAHLVRLGLALTLGLLAGALALFVRLPLTLGLALVLGALAILAIARFSRSLR